MSKIDDAKKMLIAFEMPKQQQTDICAYSLLTLLGVKAETKWKNSTNEWIRIHDILEFTNENYSKKYAENTRETIRKNCLHQFREAALIEDNGKSTNSPNYCYRITSETLALIKTYGTKSFDSKLKKFLNKYSSLKDKYTSKKKMKMMPVKINKENLNFSPGNHNLLQKLIIEEFAPRFASNCKCLYVGDTIKKDLINDTKTLKSLGFSISVHNTMPDVILYCKDKKWIYFIEAVTSVGPISPKRYIEIERMTKSVTAGKIFVTAFLDFNTYKKFSSEIAWETEVWVADAPDHMIHLNGNKFLGPRNNKK